MRRRRRRPQRPRCPTPSTRRPATARERRRLLPRSATHSSARSTRPPSQAHAHAGSQAGVDLGLRHPELFGTIEAWSAYFSPLHDGPFKHASKRVLAANDPSKLAPALGTTLRRDHTRCFLSTGPGHSHWFKPAQTLAFERELQKL